MCARVCDGGAEELAAALQGLVSQSRETHSPGMLPRPACLYRSCQGPQPCMRVRLSWGAFKKYPCLSRLPKAVSPFPTQLSPHSAGLGGALARHPRPEEEGAWRMLQRAEKRFQTDSGHTQEQVEDARKSMGDSISRTRSPTPGEQKLSQGRTRQGYGTKPVAVGPGVSVPSLP